MQEDLNKKHETVCLIDVNAIQWFNLTMFFTYFDVNQPHIHE